MCTMYSKHFNSTCLITKQKSFDAECLMLDTMKMPWSRDMLKSTFRKYTCKAEVWADRGADPQCSCRVHPAGSSGAETALWSGHRIVASAISWLLALSWSGCVTLCKALLFEEGTFLMTVARSQESWWLASGVIALKRGCGWDTMYAPRYLL